MATRDLTKKFRTIRDGEMAQVKAERIARGIDEDDLESKLLKAEKKTLAPVWVEIIENTEDYISKIKTRSNCKKNRISQRFFIYSIFFLVKHLATLHSKRLMVDFESDERSQEIEIDSVTTDITNLFKSAELQLKKLGTSPPFKESLIAFYRKHNPEKVKKIPELLEKYQGNEKIMIIRLENQACLKSDCISSIFRRYSLIL